MSTSLYGVFPFGQPVKQVEQKDRSPKKVFILGVYASAVHACWKDGNEKILVRALAVASEPEIFWTGDQKEARKIISRIKLPIGAGTLEPAEARFNGPSGDALDHGILAPLGLTRDTVWLADMHPHAAMNPSQRAALARNYDPMIKKFGLPAVTAPNVPRSLSSNRREELLAELLESGAETLITLGDLPLKWFLSRVSDARPRLAEYGTGKTYGTYHGITVAGRKMDLLPLVHPRQIAGLGIHSSGWKTVHGTWMKRHSSTKS
ncbi:MAG: hypothetical protein HY962_11560 [Ignavibacteriae bacterium]|nr:hypothetical protein [Ignavibacteriota bacterium]